MKTAIVTIEGVTPYSQSRHYETPKKPKEMARDYEERTWRDRLHFDDQGNCFIPPMAFKNCIAEAAKFLSIKTEGKATWTKHFEAGVMVMDAVPLGIKKEDVPGEWYFVPSDGRRGGGSRVPKCFPVFHKWGGKVKFYILDSKITEDAFKTHIEQAGSLIGIGRFRPRNNGFYGRFIVNDIEWSEDA